MTFNRPLTGNLIAPFFCLAAVVLNHSVFRLGALPIAYAVLFAGTVLVVAIAAPDVRLGAARRAPLRWWNVLIGAAIVAPLIISLAVSWNRDFPFSGDHTFHIRQAYNLAFWWLSPAGSAEHNATPEDIRQFIAHPVALIFSRFAMLSLIVVAVVALARWSRVAALFCATAAIIAWGLCESSTYLRYPTGGYFPALPLLGPAYLLGNIELASRAANVAAPAIWLFALRPWLVGRWPDWRVLALGILLFWQKDLIYFFNTSYLEPWALVLCLLAVEILVARGARGAAVACLFIGLAATVKEPVILALPLAWLAGAPWRQKFSETVGLSGAGLAAGAPFVLYYVARGGLDAGRGYAFNFPSGSLPLYAHELLHRILLEFPGTSAALFVAMLVVLPAMIWKLPSRALQLGSLLVVGWGLVLFFLLDLSSIAWIGYFRFLMVPLPFLAAGALALGYALRPRQALAVGAVTMALQATSAITAVSSAAGPVTGLNFIEYYDAPIFFPIRPLLAEARRANVLPPNVTVFANAPDTSLRALPDVPVVFDMPGKLTCECSKEHEAVMALFVRYANLNARFSDSSVPRGSFAPTEEREAFWLSGRAERPACLAKLQQTCRRVFQRIEGGELVAILGIR